MSEVTGAFGWLEDDGQVLLVANWRTFDGRRILCQDLPGGGVKGGESLEEACRREFLEETGLAVRVKDLAFMIERFGFRSADPGERSRYFFFHVERCESRSAPAPTDPKIVDCGYRDLAELRAVCDQPYHREIHDWLASGRSRRYFVQRA